MTEEQIFSMKKEAQKLGRILFEDGRNFVQMTVSERQQMIAKKEQIEQEIRDMGYNPHDIPAMQP